MPDPEVHYVVARCCRRWPLAIGYPVRRCGACGEVPVYTSENPDNVDWAAEGTSKRQTDARPREAK